MRRMVRLGNTLPCTLNAWTIFWKEKNRPNEYYISSRIIVNKSSWRIIKTYPVTKTTTTTNINGKRKISVNEILLLFYVFVEAISIGFLKFQDEVNECIFYIFMVMNSFYFTWKKYWRLLSWCCWIMYNTTF